MAEDARTFPVGMAPSQELAALLEATRVLALENARLFTETTRRRRQADELARIARTLTESLDVATVGARVVETVQALFGVETSTVRLLEPDGSLVSIGEVSPEPCFGVGHRLMPGAGVSGWAVVAGRPVRTRDLLADPNVMLTDELRAHAAAQRCRAMVAVPLRAKGRIIGTLSIGTAADRELAPDELALLGACADQAALALENARLYEEAERGRREAEVLAELTRAVSGSLDLDTVLQRVTDGARELCGSDTAGIALADATGGVVIRYSSGVRSEGVRNLRIEAGKGVGGQVLVTGRPFRTADYAGDPRISRDYVATVVTGEAIRCQLAVLVRIGERIEGLLYVSNRAPRPFTDRDESVLSRLAEEAAVAIQNARLFAGEQAARAEAEESGRRFRDLVQGLDAIVWECDAETWRYTFVSQRAETLLGYPIASWLGAPDFRTRLVHPDDRDRVVAFCRAAVAQGRDHEYEYRAIAADGHVAWLRETVHPVPAPEGRPRRLRGLTIDVTAGRQAEAALRESEQRFRALSRSSPVGIFLTDVEGRCTYTNPRCRVICGFPFDDTLEASWARFLHPEDRDRVLGEWAAATRAGRGYSDEFRFVVSRVVRSVHVRSAPMFSDAGALLGHVGTVEDISERKRAAETRRVLLGRVIAAQEDERARIARELHDETAQSLASLIIGLSALEQGRAPKGVRARLVELHALASAALGEVRRLAHGLRPSVLTLLGLGPAVERHAEEFGRLHQIAVSVRGEGLGTGRLPPAVETALYRIVQEALANVARHAGARAVTIDLGRDRRRVSLTVTDDGRGFDVQAARAGPADVMRLGLENMRERAAALDGELGVESAPGRGTTVRATVPLHEEPDGQDQDPPRG